METLFVVILLSVLSVGQMPMTKAQKQDCSKAVKAFKAQPVPNPSLKDYMALTDAMRKACGTPEDYAASHKASPPPTVEEITKQLDAGIEQSSTSGFTAEDSQLATDVHKLLTQQTAALNREIALGNRLIAHLQRAQTWEGIDADHPEAVALREKIAGEEKELRDASAVMVSLHDKIDMKRVQKECTVEEINSLTHLFQETTGVLNEVNTQRDRYHALGY